MFHFRVEHLLRRLPRLFEHFGAVFRVRVVVEVGAFVDETLAFHMDHQRHRVAVPIRAFGEAQMAERGRVTLPRHGVSSEIGYPTNLPICYFRGQKMGMGEFL